MRFQMKSDIFSAMCKGGASELSFLLAHRWLALRMRRQEVLSCLIDHVDLRMILSSMLEWGARKVVASPRPRSAASTSVCEMVIHPDMSVSDSRHAFLSFSNDFECPSSPWKNIRAGSGGRVNLTQGRHCRQGDRR